MSGYEETEIYRVNFLQRIATETPSLTTGRFGYYYPDYLPKNTFRKMVSWFFTFILVVGMASFFVVWFFSSFILFFSRHVLKVSSVILQLFFAYYYIDFR